MKKYITKQSSIKGAGKGLFTKDFFKKGEVIGLAHVDDQPASEIGRNHNHNEKNPTAYSKKINNKRFIYASRNLKPGEEITTNYRMQPELEQPEDFMRKGGALLTKKVTCKSCGWEWDAEDGGKDITTCHKCGGQGLIHAQKGGESKCLNGQVWSKKDKKCIDLPVFGNSLNSGTFTKSTNLSDGFKIKPLNSFSDFGKIKPKKIPVIKDNFLETLEKDINDFLDNPKAKAAQLSESLADKDEVASDALRHSTAGALAAQTIANKTGNIPFISNPLGYLGANIAGIGHELSTLSQAYLDDRPWSVKLQESLEDIYNNSVGANTIFNNNSEKDKINYLLKLTRTNQLPDGYGEERPFRDNPKWTDPYNQKQYGGLHKFVEGGKPCDTGYYWNGTKCVKIPKNTRIVYHTDKDVYDKAFAAESDSSHFYNSAKSDFNKFDKLGDRFSTPMSNEEWQKTNDQYFKLLNSQKKKWHTDEYIGNIYSPNRTVNYKYKGPKSGLTIKPVGLEGFYREGYRFPRFKKPVIHNVYEEPIVEEKIENLPFLKPGLIDSTKDELQGNTLNEEELELPNEEVESEYLEEGSPDTENPMEWVNKRKYDIDWNGIQIPYRLPRFRKPGSYGDLIKPGKKRYINLPTIESRNTAYLRPKKQDGGNTDAMTGMMKARLAYANEFGNPAAKRMINLPDNPYQFDNGDTGSHYMASMDNYAVPQIQDENGVLQLGDYGPESNEAIRFDSDEDANYFAENYKDVSPGFIEAELDEDEIEEYRRGGYIVEEIDTYQKGGTVYTVKGSKGYYKKVNGQWQVDWNRSGKYQPLSKGDVKARTAVLDKMAKPVDNGISKVLSNSSDNTRVNYQKPLVESFNRSNNLESFYKKEREKDLQKQKDATAYHDKTQKVKQNQSFGEFLNQDVLGIPTYEEQIDQVTNDKKLLKKELKPYFETEKELDQFVNQQYSRPTASAENNWNDGPIQLVYPEKYGIGPGGGMIGNIKNLGINTFNLGKKVLSNPYVSGGLNAYFLYHGINEFNDPNSHTRKSTNRAWNNPTPTNVKHALYDNSINLLNFVALPFGKTINGSKTLIKELKQLPSSSIKKLSSILYKPKTNSLQIKSTMVGSPLEKQLSKSGEININSIKAHIGKSDVSLQDKFIINKILNEQFAGKIKINYNDFKKAVSKQLVPLERSFDDRYNDYGLKRLGFGEGDKRRINVDILLTKSQINILEKYKKNIPLYLKDHGWKHQIPTIDGKFTYPKNSELKNEIQKLLNDKKFELENFKKDLLLTGGDKVIKNSSIVYGNKNMFGIGSTQHFENEGALGHSRIFVSKNEPKIMHVLEQQSDYYQNNNILKEQLNLKLDYEHLINKQKMLLEEEKILNEYKYKYKNNINDKNGDKINKSQLDQIEENLLKKKHNIELRLNNLKNPEQKLFLGKYQQERLLQENVAYAAEQGKTKMRYPTPETASKIQGYVQRIQTGDNAPEFAKLQEEISIATRQGDQEKVNELMKVHDEILNTPYKSYHPEHHTILKKYLDQPKMIKKIFKQDVKIITDNKGNTWYEFDIPEKFKKGNAEIRAFSNGGENNNYIDINLTPEEIQKYKDGGYVVEELPEMQSGGSPSQVWYQYTGTPWSEARKKGLTDGSKEQNTELRKKILAGKFGKPKFSNEKYQNIESNYDRNIEKMVAQGKTLDQLVKQKVGTRVGLKSRFPELFKTKSKLDDFLPKKNNSTSSKTQNKITTPVKNRWGNVTVESNNGKPIYRKDDYIDMVQSKDSKTKAEGLKMQAEHKKQLQAEKIKKQKKDLLNVEALLANAANAANTHKAQVKAIEAARVAKLSDEEKLYEYFLGKPNEILEGLEAIPGINAVRKGSPTGTNDFINWGNDIKWDMNKGLLEQKWFPFSEKLIESQKYKPEGFFKMFPDPSTKEAQAYLKAEQAKENAKKEEEDFQYREAMIKENPETSIEEIDQFIQDQESIAYENSIAGPHNNYNDGPVQMVYPERVFAYGPSGGILGGLLRNPYVMGAGNLYFGAQGISEWADSDSDLRKSISKAWDDPTWSNIGDFGYELGANSLNYIGLPFSKYYKNSRNVTKIPIPKKYGPFKPRKPKTINLNQNPRWLQLPKYNSKGYLEYKKYQDGGNVSKLGKQKIDNYKLDKEIVSDLSKEEINKLVSQGYIVEQIN